MRCPSAAPAPPRRPVEDSAFASAENPDFAAVAAALAEEYQANNDRGRRSPIARFWALFPELRGGAASCGSAATGCSGLASTRPSAPCSGGRANLCRPRSRRGESRTQALNRTQPIQPTLPVVPVRRQIHARLGGVPAAGPVAGARTERQRWAHASPWPRSGTGTRIRGNRSACVSSLTPRRSRSGP